MARGYGGWAPYVPVANRRRKAAREIARLRKGGHPVAPVEIAGRAIAGTFWGKAWCDNLESYRDYENRLPRGRSYVRNGSVLDLQVAPLEVKALVQGSSIYEVAVRVKPIEKARWRALCRDCAGAIGSLIELLEGRLSKAVMERLCRQEEGLFPRPSEIRFSCSCPDAASMCKHVAAVLYGIGSRLDNSPDLLFRLRGADEHDLVSNLDAALPLSKTAPDAGKLLDADDLAALFGLDMAGAKSSLPPPLPAKTAKRGTAARKKGVRLSAAVAAIENKTLRKEPATAKKVSAGRLAQDGLALYGHGRGRKPWLGGEALGGVAMTRPADCGLIGRWRIVRADLWDEDYLDLVGPAHVIFDRDFRGEFAFGAIEATMDLEYARTMISFKWEGFDEGDRVSGTGSAKLMEDGSLRIELSFFDGDDAVLKARRA